MAQRETLDVNAHMMMNMNTNMNAKGMQAAERA